MSHINKTQLRNQIESLDKIHHIKVLKIIKENEIKFSENRNGVFVNMNALNDKTIIEIVKMLEYIKQQEKTLTDIEKIKEELNKDYFENNNKDIKDNISNKDTNDKLFTE